MSLFEQEPQQPTPSVDSIRVAELTQGKHLIRQAFGSYAYEDLPTVGPVQCQWHFQLEPVALVLGVKIKTILKLECSRCLQLFEVPVDLHAKERFVFQSSLVQADKAKELHAHDFYEVLEDEGTLDLKELAHQFLVMETAEHPYCQQPGCDFE